MAHVDKKIVEDIAQLARLELTDAEEQKYQKELSAILGYIDVLNEVDTTVVEPAAQVTGLLTVMREDKKVASELSRDEILKNAPQKQDGYIKVKSVLE